jgi:hypothetical protein
MEFLPFLRKLRTDRSFTAEGTGKYTMKTKYGL